MRHDCARRRPPNTSTEQFEKDLPVLIAACRELADYAAQYGIVTSIENHGMHLQASERVRRLVLGVARPNFKTTIDVGNFVCVDEEPYFAVRDNLPFASFIHVKDFHRKPPAADPGEGWNRSSGGAWWRGAIAGHGDIDLPTIVRAIKASGYDGYLSLEFEGLEDPRLGCRIGLDNVKRYWREA
ncbi:MAG: Inosose dehydratase [candidate division BRC1 bacterium ADurb.BinA364]|nr:MAG: Inosose dehydratase [candidate division BRC1 bacterium ADurb.BinA364]